MGPLSRNGCRALSSALGTIYGVRSIGKFPAEVLSAIRRLLPCNTICFNEMVDPNSMTTWVTEPANALPGPLLRQAFLRNLPQHPVLAHYVGTGDGASYRISDFISRQQFHCLPLYSEYYQPSNVEYQLIGAISIGQSQIGVALDRDTSDFSDEERLSLQLLRPHLVQAYRNVQTIDLMRQVIEGKRRKLMIVNRSGNIISITDDVWRMMDKYFEVPRSHNSPPDALLRWIECERTRLGEDGDIPSPPVPLVSSKVGQRLTVRFLWGGKTADYDAVLMEEEQSQSLSLLAESSLTPRESEILAWLTQGKTNVEIGLALSISPLTVKKHLEHIYSKMQVHRRTAAISHTSQFTTD